MIHKRGDVVAFTGKVGYHMCDKAPKAVSLTQETKDSLSNEESIEGSKIENLKHI